MADVHSKEVRSYNMSRVRNKDTKPERLVRSFLFRNRFRFRLHVETLPGKPDIVLPKYRTVVFIHGCFWHGHENCKYFVVPQTRTEWWLVKINRNKIKDMESVHALRQLGWRVIVVFECELKSPNRENTLTSLLAKLKEHVE